MRSSLCKHVSWYFTLFPCLLNIQSPTNSLMSLPLQTCSALYNWNHNPKRPSPGWLLGVDIQLGMNYLHAHRARAKCKEYNVSMKDKDLPFQERICPQILKLIILKVGLKIGNIKHTWNPIFPWKVYLVSIVIDLLKDLKGPLAHGMSLDFLLYGNLSFVSAPTPNLSVGTVGVGRDQPD